MKTYRVKANALVWIAAVFFTVSCTTPKVHILDRPAARKGGATASQVHARLSRESASYLRERGLRNAFRVDPKTVIFELREALPTTLASGDRLALARLCSEQGDRLASSDPEEAIGYHLAAAELSFERAAGGAKAGMGDYPYTVAYNHCAGQVAELLFNLEGNWAQQREFKGPWSSYLVRGRREVNGFIDPHYFDSLVPSEYVELKNFDVDRIVVPGIGGAMVGYREGTEARRAKNPFLSSVGMTVPVNATLDFRSGGRIVDVGLADSTLRQRINLNGRSLPLASDLTAPLAVQISHDPDRRSGWKGMTHPDAYLDRAGLFLLEPYRSDQIPVVLVHGLMSNPQVWLKAVNQLRADPVLRHRYQLIVYRYPTGFPILFNAAALRQRLQEFQAHFDPQHRNPDMNRMLLVGHSMGGILSNAQVRGSGDAQVKNFFDRPIDELEGLDADHRATIRRLLLYQANPYITRAILVGAPLRGSHLANSAESIAHTLIRFPSKLVTQSPLPEVEGMTELGRWAVTHRPDGVWALKEDSPILMGILENPARDGVTLHSIVSRYDPQDSLEESSDTVVPYVSAHLDEAVSEKVIQTKHGDMCDDPEAIAEIRRILYLHAGLGVPR